MKRTIGLLLAAALTAPALADPVLGASGPLAAPINVNGCNLEYASDTSVASRISGVTVQFTNESPRVADLVNFRVEINGQSSLVRDVGTFSPGIEIVHKYRAGTDQFALPVVLQQFSGRPPVTCRVESVHFADGGSWLPASGGAGSPTVAALPATLAFSGPGDAARLLFVTANARAVFAVTGNCDGIVSVTRLAQSARDAVYRIAPRAPGYCALTLGDANGNGAMVAVAVAKP